MKLILSALIKEDPILDFFKHDLRFKCSSEDQLTEWIFSSKEKRNLCYLSYNTPGYNPTDPGLAYLNVDGNFKGLLASQLEERVMDLCTEINEGALEKLEELASTFLHLEQLSGK